MTTGRKIIAVLLFAGLPALHPASAEQKFSAANAGAKSTYKILHIMSYHSPWRWTDGQFDGFREALKGLDAEYRVFQMDTKRNNSKQWMEKKGEEARGIIEEWKPDMVYTSDDDAQEYVTKYYINADIPFVFSGVNRNPEEYGFAGSRNITGVVEHEHFVESVRLLKDIVPDVKRIAVVLDDAPMWAPVVARTREKSARLEGVKFVSWDIIETFDEYREKIREYQGTADALALIGIFNFKDRQGRNVAYQEVLKWTAENSRLPDFGFWIDRVHYGTLCAVNVSEYEQGLAAGRIARSILSEGGSPSDFPMKPTLKGCPIVSLARADKLGVKVKSGVLLASEVIRSFEWDK